MKIKFKIKNLINIVRILPAIGITAFISCGVALAQAFPAENPNCVEMVIDGQETMRVCDEEVAFEIDGEKKVATIKSTYSSEYVNELIKSNKYIVPLERIGYHPDKTPKTYLLSYVETQGCIDANRIEYEGKPSDKSEICFCEVDLDRNIADISHKYEEGDFDMEASEQFFQNNKCDVYVPGPKVIKPTPVPTPTPEISLTSTPDPVDPNPTDPVTPTDPSECLIPEEESPDVNVGGNEFLFPLIPETKPTDWDGVRLTQGFGDADGSLGYTTHTGIDLGYVQGTPVVATRDGLVEFAVEGWNDGYGNLVIIRHEAGGRKYYTYHAHLYQIDIEQGETVKVGQQIGQVGTTGNSTGNHLHFEIRDCANISTIRTSCIPVNPVPRIVFKITNENQPPESKGPVYDQECLDRIREREEEEEGSYEPGQKFECMFKYAADAVDNITGEAIYAIAKQESGSAGYEYFICPKTWDSWATGGDRKQCENNPLETALASRNGYNSDPNIDVRGLTQFQATTFSSLVKNNREQMDKCIERLGGKTTFQQDSNLYDPVIDADLRANYSRHVVSHIICATAVKLKQDSVVFKDEVKDSGYGYQFTDQSIFLSKQDWDEIVLNDHAANIGFTGHTQLFNALDYVGHRYHGSCRRDRIMRGNQSYYDAYCDPINNYYKQAKQNNIFEGCGKTTTTPEPVETPKPIEANKIEAKYCSAECTDCKYFPISKTNPTRENYAPVTQEVPNSIFQHTLIEKARLTPETIEAMGEMFIHAETQGVDLALRTGYRSYQYQRDLFNSYVQQELNKDPGISREEATRRANAYSAIPGQSEHQLGTTADVTCADCVNDPFGNNSGTQKAFRYLAENGYKYGFIVSYTPENTNVSKYDAEGWHIRYIGRELAEEYMQQYNAFDGEYSLDTFFTNKCQV